MEWTAADGHGNRELQGIPEALVRSFSRRTGQIDAELDRLEGIYRMNLARPGVQIFDTRAELEDPHTVRLASGERFSAGHILVGYLGLLLLGAAASTDGPLALLVPVESALFRWSLEQGLRALKPMNLMARGDYQEPQGAWFPAVIY